MSYNKYRIVFMQTNKKLIGDVIGLRKFNIKDPVAHMSDLQQLKTDIVNEIKTYIDAKFTSEFNSIKTYVRTYTKSYVDSKIDK